MEGAVAIEADRVEWSAGSAVAEGSVTVRFADQELVGTRATWDGTTVVVESGTYRRPGETLVFDRAEVQLAAGTAVLVEARADTGEGAIVADRITVGERWEAAGAVVYPCRCADGKPPALSLRAGRITVVPEKVAILHGGVIRVFSVPVLPVPYWEEPLDPHRFRLLLPEVGWGEYGPSAKIEGRGGVGDWYLQGGPAWRYDRGFRGDLALTGPNVVAEGALGWDDLTRTVRGALATKGGVDRTVRLAWDTTIVSDDTYVEDYSVDYVTRGVAYRESRAVAAFFHGASTWDVWVPDDESAPVDLRARFALPVPLGRIATVTPRLVFSRAGGSGLLSELGAGARAGGAAGPIALEARADLAGRLAFDTDVLPTLGEREELGALTTWGEGLATLGRSSWGDPLGDGPLAREGEGATGVGGVAQVEATVPFWSELGGGRAKALRFQWWPGLRAEARGGSWLDGDAAAVRAGPAVRVATGFDAGTITLDGAVFQDGTGWAPAASLDVSFATFTTRVQADPDVQVGEVRWSPAPVSFGVGTAHHEGGMSVAGAPLWLGWGDAGLALGRLRTGGGVAWDLDGAAFSGAQAYVGYDDGCVAATVTARFAPDRDLPDFGFAATVRK